MFSKVGLSMWAAALSAAASSCSMAKYSRVTSLTASSIMPFATRSKSSWSWNRFTLAEQQPQHVQQVSTGFLLTILQLNNNPSIYNRSVQDFYSQFSNWTTTPAYTTGQYRIFTHNSPTEQQPQHIQQVSTGFLLTILQLNNNPSIYNRSVQDFYSQFSNWTTTPACTTGQYRISTSQFSNWTTTPACTTGQYRIFTHNSPTEQQLQHVQQVSTGFLPHNSKLGDRFPWTWYCTVTTWTLLPCQITLHQHFFKVVVEFFVFV